MLVSDSGAELDRVAKKEDGMLDFQAEHGQRVSVLLLRITSCEIEAADSPLSALPRSAVCTSGIGGFHLQAIAVAMAFI